MSTTVSKSLVRTMYDVRPIPRWPGYLASPAGEVFSVKRRTMRKLRQSPDTGGYLVISLSKNGRSCTKRVHALILETFVGPRPAGYESRHLNGNKTDNRACNLRWGTHRENTFDAIDHGTQVCLRRGEDHGSSKTTDDAVVRIRTMYAGGVAQMALAKLFGLHQTTISKIVNRKTWTHM